jgi:hypothetical protein
MGCLLFVIAVVAPRVLMVFIFLLTDWFPAAFKTTLWPILGFILMPYTTLAWMAGELHGGVRGMWTLLVVLAVLVDLGHMFGGGKHYSRCRRRHV